MVASDSVFHSGLVSAYLAQTFGQSISVPSFLLVFFHGLDWWFHGCLVLGSCLNQVRGWLQQLVLLPQMVRSGGPVGGPSFHFQF